MRSYVDDDDYAVDDDRRTLSLHEEVDMQGIAVPSIMTVTDSEAVNDPLSLPWPPTVQPEPVQAVPMLVEVRPRARGRPRKVVMQSAMKFEFPLVEKRERAAEFKRFLGPAFVPGVSKRIE